MTDALDRAIIEATQTGLPLTPRPYHMLAERLGVDAATVIDRMGRMQAQGIVRRIGAVPNHYALGYRGNGMTVWDVVDDLAADLGRRVGELDFVSHCYLRPRHPRVWPYNLFAMVHGKDREEVLGKAAQIADVLGPHSRRHETLFSKRILKKTGLRISSWPSGEGHREQE